MNGFVLLYLGFVFPGLVFLAYAFPAMRMAHALSWRRAGALVGLTLVLMVLAAFATMGIIYVIFGAMDSDDRTTRIISAIAMALALVTIFLSSLLQGVIFEAVVNDRTPLKLFIRNGWTACLAVFLLITPSLFGKLTGWYNSVPLVVGYVISSLVLIGWHVLLAKGLFNWADVARANWRIRNYLCIHCATKVSRQDQLCPECGEACRAW